MTVPRVFISAMLAVTLLACSPGEQAAPTGGLGVPSGTYAVDKSHTYVVFSYLHQDLSYPLLRATDIEPSGEYFK